MPPTAYLCLAMQPVKTGELSLWQFHNLRAERGVKHFVTGRQPHIAAEFTLSYSSWPDRAVVESNRETLAGALGINASALYFPSQVHETRIAEVTSGLNRKELDATDALITSEPGLCIAVMSADCVPVLLYDRQHKAVAAVHAGWRGTVARIVEKTLRVMAQRYGTWGKDVVAGIGPSASVARYEVGQEVIEAVNASFGTANTFIIPTKPGKGQLDLWKANETQLLDFGVNRGAIEVSNLCTLDNNHTFFSARRGDKGRFAAGIMLTEHES